MKTSVGRLGWALILCITLSAMVGCGSGQKEIGKAGAQGTPTAPTAEKPKVPLIPKVEVADWCIEHGVPESACTRCNSKLIADFKAKSDWCDQHSLPRSQCVTCDPAVKAKLEALHSKAR